MAELGKDSEKCHRDVGRFVTVLVLIVSLLLGITAILLVMKIKVVSILHLKPTCLLN